MTLLEILEILEVFSVLKGKGMGNLSNVKQLTLGRIEHSSSLGSLYMKLIHDYTDE